MMTNRELKGNLRNWKITLHVLVIPQKVLDLSFKRKPEEIFADEFKTKFPTLCIKPVPGLFRAFFQEPIRDGGVTDADST